MVCPRCKREHDVLKYEPMMMIEEYAEETVQIIKCPSCRWVFAPAPDLFPAQVEEIIRAAKVGATA